MTCFEIQEHLLDYIDNELPASLQQVVEEHVHACLACREEVESYRKTAVLLQLRAVPEPPPTYWDERWERIRSGFKARVLPMYGQRLVSPSRWLWLKRFALGRVAAVAAIVLVVVTVLWWNRQARQRELTEAARRSTYVSESARNVLLLDDNLPEDVRRQIELIAVSRAAFGSIDPISKGVILARMEVDGR